MTGRCCNHVERSPKSIATTALFLIAAIWVILNTHRWSERQILQWDTDGYYLYLPATFIHHDLTGLAFLEGIPPGSFPPDYRFGQGAFAVPATGRMCNKYPMGVAVFEAPFFAVAHAWCALFDPAKADGYSPPYHLAVALSSAVYAWLGLVILAILLRRYLGDLHTAIAIAVIGFGTNLFFYSSYAGGMSHPVLFFLCALLLERTDRWLRAPSPGTATVIGACIGLATLTRPTCALFAMIPLCWSVAHGIALRRYIVHSLVAAVVALLCVLPQVLYWKATTGRSLFYSYGTEGFDLLRPHIVDGLFSFRKGWFVYTPLALVPLVGVPLLRKDERLRSYPIMLLCFFPIFLYITFAWTSWWYGGGFGSRVMIDSLPLLALPLGVLVQRSLSGRPVVRLAFLALLLGGIVLNLFQQWQYIRGIIHYEAMTMERWWQVFLERTTVGLPPFP